MNDAVTMRILCHMAYRAGGARWGSAGFQTRNIYQPAICYKDTRSYGDKLEAAINHQISKYTPFDILLLYPHAIGGLQWQPSFQTAVSTVLF